MPGSDMVRPGGAENKGGFPRVLAVGDAAVAVEFGAEISPEVHARVLAFDRAVATAAEAGEISGVVETVPTYCSLLLHLDPLAGAEGLEDALAGLAAEAAEAEERAGRLWHVPVAYGGEFGEDLADLAAAKGMAGAEAIELHASAEYRVYMLGFAPGFAYLGGLPEALATPRRADPRAVTPAGSISIGGAQAAVTSMAVPSGWHLIGRTPVRTFQPEGERPFLFEPGDRVRFEPIDSEDYATLAEKAAAGETVARLEES